MAGKSAESGKNSKPKGTLAQVGRDCFALQGHDGPNCGVIIGDDSVLVVDARPTPIMAAHLVALIAEKTDKPIKHVVLTHYHAEHTLGAAGYHASDIIASDLTRNMIKERGEQDRDCALARHPDLFVEPESIRGLTWPSLTFATAISVGLGRREVRLMNLGRGHTMGDIVAWVPDADVMYCGDLVAPRAAAYCGDAHLKDWPATLERFAAFNIQTLVPATGEILRGADKVATAVAGTGKYVQDLAQTVSRVVERNGGLRSAYSTARRHLDPKYGDKEGYELHFAHNVARAFDEASGIDHPKIWTRERDRELMTKIADVVES